MLIPENIESKLKFDKIKNAVISHCKTDIGRNESLQMHFLTSFEDVTLHTNRTAEMASILDTTTDFPASELPDIRESLHNIRIEGLYLKEEELLALRISLSLTADIKTFFENTEPNDYPLLKNLCEDLYPYPLILNQIDRILDQHGEIKDSASPTLSDLRREIKAQEIAAQRQINAIMKKAQNEGLVDSEASISIRNGIPAIPIAAANKRKIDGIVIDESATGRTAFIQPDAVVAINNKINELHSEERREIIKILKDITANIRPYTADIILSTEILGEVDFIRAKALYAKDIDAVLPIIENRQGLYLSGARHPILMAQLQSQGKKIVPLNIELEAPQSRILIISGPNAGGKSVCLQSVCLIQYMLQCGMLVPVNNGSRMGIFENLFIDIGDNQSIENDLSTYSSHLLAMKNFMRNANNKTLLLIDEFGTGTEPSLGGAIAESVLNELNNLGAFGVLTTHYTNLKHFASQTTGLINGAMTFDVQKIEPLFSLHIGQPGSSFAFEIARKIGIPERILQDAKEKMGQENADYDRNLRQIVRDKHYWEQKRQNVKENDKKLADTLQKYNDLLANIKAERKEIIAQAKEEAKELLAQANKQIENTIREIKQSQAEKEKTKEARKKFDDFKKETEADNTTEADALIERKMEQIRRRQERQKNRSSENTPQPTETAQPAPTPINTGD